MTEANISPKVLKRLELEAIHGSFDVGGNRVYKTLKALAQDNSVDYMSLRHAAGKGLWLNRRKKHLRAMERERKEKKIGLQTQITSQEDKESLKTAKILQKVIKLKAQLIKKALRFQEKDVKGFEIKCLCEALKSTQEVIANVTSGSPQHFTVDVEEVMATIIDPQAIQSKFKSTKKYVREKRYVNEK